jgi:hypothetical protein
MNSSDLQAQKKADDILQDTALIRDIFELKEESCVQSYRCAYWREGDKLPSQVNKDTHTHTHMCDVLNDGVPGCY